MTKILVIEDEATLREEVMDWLRSEGYEAFGAEDGMVGVEYAALHVPDLIVAHTATPRLDGYGVLLEMHANPLTARIPFIFLTAGITHEDRRKVKVWGADYYITKPFSRLEFLQAVQARLEKHTAQKLYQEQQIAHLQAALTQEHEERMLRTKLVAMFSHDFRNQLSVILSSSTLVRDYGNRLAEERRLKHMNGIEAAVHLLTEMLDDMLIVAQMESGNLILDAQPLNVGEFLHDLVAEFQAVSGRAYQLHLDSKGTDMMMIDVRLLRQIAANLISNAIKYSPQGGEVLITADNQDAQCILMVQDKGIGISEADQIHLFDAFQRGKNVGAIEGTGLGLAIVKQAVDMQGGAIHLDSQLGVGTAVTVTIPCPVVEI